MKGKGIRAFFLHVRDYAKKIFTLRSDPRQIALGFAIGVFIGIFPTFGIGLLLLSFLSVFIKFNIPAGIIGGTLVANPLTTPFWALLSYKTGKAVTGFLGMGRLIMVQNPSWKKALSFGIDYLIGNLILSFSVSVLSYFVIRRIVEEYKARKKKRKRRRNRWKK